jgi:hypothetical protein
MKKRRRNDAQDELRPEYDLRELLKRGVRGKYAERYRSGTNLVLLEPDVARAFSSEQAINEALRLVIRLTNTRRAKKPLRVPAAR